LRGGFRALHLAGTRRPTSSPPVRHDAEIINAGICPTRWGRERWTCSVDSLRPRPAPTASLARPRSILHEAGDDDAIFDVVGVLLALRDLGVEEVMCSVVPLGLAARDWG